MLVEFENIPWMINSSTVVTIPTEHTDKVVAGKRYRFIVVVEE